jgi:hypothetical protein
MKPSDRTSSEFSLVRTSGAWAIVLLVLCSSALAQNYLGFDRNDYPGDANLQSLRQTFSYTGYWLQQSSRGNVEFLGWTSRRGWGRRIRLPGLFAGVCTRT